MGVTVLYMGYFPSRSVARERTENREAGGEGGDVYVRRETVSGEGGGRGGVGVGGGIRGVVGVGGAHVQRHCCGSEDPSSGIRAIDWIGWGSPWWFERVDRSRIVD